MSHIPSSAMPHAKKHDDGEKAPTPSAPAAKRDGGDLVGRAKATVQRHRTAAIAIGATLVAGLAAAAAAPALLARNKAPTGKKKPSGGSRKKAARD